MTKIKLAATFANTVSLSKLGKPRFTKMLLGLSQNVQTTSYFVQNTDANN